MLLVYVVGPYRAATPWDIERNVRSAEEVGAQIVHAGAYPVIPHANTRFFQDLREDEFFLEGTMELLCRCDAVMLAAGWRNSEGSLAEIEMAQEQGLPVFEELSTLRSWISGHTLADGLAMGKGVVYPEWFTRGVE